MPTPSVIILEEHFVSKAFSKFRGDKDTPRQRQLEDMGEVRIKAMDEAGIDFQILSEKQPAAHNLDPETAVAMARASNDELHAAMRAHPTRFGGFAALPTPDPKAAADELERTVTKLGFKGAMIMGTTHGRFLDEQDFWPIFERAVALDVPVYLHPSPTHPAVLGSYFKGHEALAGAALGYTIETLTHSFRLITGGVFEKFPTLKVIVGHLGETAPFLLWRADDMLKETVTLPRSLIDTYKDRFWLTTSGAFSDTALACTIAEMGVERVLFSVDWPFASNTHARHWIDKAPVSDEERAMILGGNARRLLKM
jgi:predicted TIM-barrel fold metal-dependent hydrolase